MEVSLELETYTPHCLWESHLEFPKASMGQIRHCLPSVKTYPWIPIAEGRKLALLHFVHHAPYNLS